MENENVNIVLIMDGQECWGCIYSDLIAALTALKWENEPFGVWREPICKEPEDAYIKLCQHINSIPEFSSGMSVSEDFLSRFYVFRFIEDKNIWELL